MSFIATNDKPTLSARVRTMAATKDYVFGAVGPVVVGTWYSRPSQEGVQMLSALCVDTLLHHPHIGIVIIPTPTAGVPEAAVRRTISEVLRAQTRAVGVALVVEGKGFRAATIRSVVTGIALVARLPFPLEISRTVDEAAAWLTGRLAAVQGAVPPTLAKDIAGFRSQHPI